MRVIEPRGLLAAVSLAAAVGVSIVSADARAQGTAPVTPEVRRQFTEAFERQSRFDTGIPPDGARVVILKFTDYECPGCRQSEMMYRPVLDKFATSHPKAIKYVVKDWPWNSTCNFNTSRTIPGHEASCDAAVAARVARDRGKPEVMADWLYANQGATPAAVREAARQLLGVTDFEKEAALKLPEIQRDIADGGVLVIQSTPTYFINGIKLPGVVPAELFELAITLELNRAAR